MRQVALWGEEGVGRLRRRRMKEGEEEGGECRGKKGGTGTGTYEAGEGRSGR